MWRKILPFSFRNELDENLEMSEKVKLQTYRRLRPNYIRNKSVMCGTSRIYSGHVLYSSDIISDGSMLDLDNSSTFEIFLYQLSYQYYYYYYYYCDDSIDVLIPIKIRLKLIYYFEYSLEATGFFRFLKRISTKDVIATGLFISTKELSWVTVPATGA